MTTPTPEERAEWLRIAEYWRTEYDDIAPEHGMGDALFSLLGALATAERERAEAERGLDLTWAEVERIYKAERERDEARAASERLRGLARSLDSAIKAWFVASNARPYDAGLAAQAAIERKNAESALLDAALHHTEEGS